MQLPIAFVVTVGVMKNNWDILAVLDIPGAWSQENL